MKKTVFILIALIAATIIKVDAQYVQDRVTGERLSVKRFDGIRGTPYFEEDFAEGDIFLTDGTVFEDAMLRYNAYEDEIEYSHDGRLYALKNELVSEFHLRYNRGGGVTDTIIFRKGYKGESLDSQTFYIVHYEGDITLLERFTQRFQEDMVPGYGQASAEKRFTPTSRLFFKEEDKSVKQVNNRRTSVLNALTESSFFGRLTNEKRRELRQHIRDENLDMSKPSDIAILLEYYDENF